ncbi:MAG: hypothetical protein KatS3mg043_0242 [Rhodothermaceae bacterium]|nr:MAG: hypothetical protein KatS3mg043_0242 [Rhodothermaceae bacterium]
MTVRASGAAGGPGGEGLGEVEAGARRLMGELGLRHLGASLFSLGWTFGFDRARRRPGCCRWRRGEVPLKRITLSKHFAAALGWAGMEAVMRHEIAHALDFETRGRSGHDDVWKAWALQCGAEPTRCYEGDEPAGAAAPYQGTCPSCGAVYPFYRRLKRPRACGACCDRYNGGRYAAAFRLVIRRR